MVWIIFYIILSTNLFAQEKSNICFVTINSSEEKNLFTKYLSEGENRGKFEFHELTALGNQTNWFSKACESKLSCDVLIISGHYGGSFFGKTDFILRNDQLETKSCQRSCPGILRAPQEVFLLGCNTLASKEGDTRTPYQYLQALLRDNLSFDDAAQAVEVRYGSFGSSFKKKMERVFNNVPHIYGFDSKGPSGSTIERYLIDYLNKIPDYQDHLIKAEARRSLSMMGHFENWNQSNKELSASLSITDFAQTSGELHPCPGLLGDDNSNEISHNICLLRGGHLSSGDELPKLLELMASENVGEYFESIRDYVIDKGISLKVATALQEIPEIKTHILSLVDEASTSFGRIKIARMAYDIGVISKNEFNEIERGVILKLLTPPVANQNKAEACSYLRNNRNSLRLKKADLKPEHYKDRNFLSSLICFNTVEKDILNEVALGAHKSNDLELKKAGLFVLRNNDVDSAKVNNFLKHAFHESEDFEVRSMAFHALVKNGGIDEQTVKFFNEQLKSNREMSVFGETSTTRSMAVDLLNFVRPKNYAVFQEVRDGVKLNTQYSETQFPLAKFAAQLKGNDAKTFLTDPQNKSLKRYYYQALNRYTRSVDNYIPAQAFEVVYRDYLQGLTDEGIWYSFNWSDEFEVRTFIEKLESSDLNKEESSKIIEQLPSEVREKIKSQGDF